MEAEFWIPGSEDVRAGREAYVRYIGGLIVLHDPDCDVSRGIIGNTLQADPNGVEAVITHAEEIMYKGLRAMITTANPPEYRSSIINAEHRHGQALPIINQMVASACREESERLDRINPAITSMRPMPLSDQATYASFCHGRLNRINTTRLMDVFMPSPQFAEALADRVLTSLTRRRSHLSSTDDS